MSDNSSYLVLVALAPIITLVPFLIMILCFCVPRCKGKIKACRAKVLPPEESQWIINYMQGDWDVTYTPGNCCMCGCTSYHRMAVTGSVVARVNPDSGRGLYSIMANLPIYLRPARAADGTLLLDEYGSKATVWRPDKGRIQTETLGWIWDWRKVGWRENMEQRQRSLARQVVSSGQKSVADEIQRLHRLKLQGAITEEEYHVAKYNLLQPGGPDGGYSAPCQQHLHHLADLEAGVPFQI